MFTVFCNSIGVNPWRLGSQPSQIFGWGSWGFQEVVGGREWVSENNIAYFAQKVR